MKKTDITKVLKKSGIDFEIFGSQKDKSYKSYELKLIKDKNTSLWTNLPFDCSLKDVENMIEDFNNFDYRERAKKVFLQH